MLRSPAGLGHDGNKQYWDSLVPSYKGMELMHIPSILLIIFDWIIAAILIFFLLLIGRFYEIRFGSRSRFQLMLVPLALFVIAAVWDAAFVNNTTGDPLLDFVGALAPDLLFFLGGAILIALAYYLFKTMMRGRR